MDLNQVVREQNEAATPPTVTDHLNDVAKLTDQLNLLLKKYRSLLETEGLSDRVKILREWSDTYSNGLAAAGALAQTGNEWITQLSERVKLAADELNRLEGEGGPPATNEQRIQADELHHVGRKLEQIAPRLDQQLTPQEDDDDRAAADTPLANSQTK